MVGYSIGSINEKEEIIDFLNYVFSQSRAPHDFKKLLPKSYSDRATDLGAAHYLARQDGKLKAVVANRTVNIDVCGNILKLGFIGNVSVHPYSRGAGYMKKLMSIAVDDARQNGTDILVLGGQRQRYGYFGFENAGANLHFNISRDNIRHCFSNVDCSDISFRPLAEENCEEADIAAALYEKGLIHALRERERFVDIMHTWDIPCRAVYKKEKMIGYVYGTFNETVLENEEDFAAVLKAFFETYKPTEADISVAPHQRERASFLSGICESSAVRQVEMINVLCWERVLKAFLELKSKITRLVDGETVLIIDGIGYRICVADGAVSVSKADNVKDGAIHMSHNQAECALFGIESLVFPDERLKNWAPLPFTIDLPDSY